MRKLLFGALALAVLAGAVVAESDFAEQNQKWWLEDSAKQTVCGTEYQLAVASVISNASGIRIDTDKLNSVMARMRNAADSGDLNEYRGALMARNGELRGFGEGLLKNLRGLALRVRGRENVSIANITAQIKALAPMRDACLRNASIVQAEARLAQFNSLVAKYQNQTNTLSGKTVGNGTINVAGLQAVLDGAKAKVLDPLSAAITEAKSSNSTPKQVREATVGAFCLYNGCPKGFNYHLQVRWEAARIAAIAEAEKAGASDAAVAKLNSAEALLANVSTTLDSLGDSRYANGTGGAVMRDLRQAAQLIREARRLKAAPSPTAAPSATPEATATATPTPEPTATPTA